MEDLSLPILCGVVLVFQCLRKFIWTMYMNANVAMQETIAHSCNMYLTSKIQIFIAKG